MNFQIAKLVFEKPEEPRSNCQCPLDHWKTRTLPEEDLLQFYLEFDFLDYNKHWEIPKQMWIPVHLTCLLINLYAGQEATVRTGNRTTEWFQIGKGIPQGCIIVTLLIYLLHRVHNEKPWAGEITRWNKVWQKYQWPQMCRGHHLYGRKWRRTKEPLDESETGEWISCLKAQHARNLDHGIRFHHFMANRWGNSGNSRWFIFLDSKITADGDSSHEIKRHLLLGRKGMTNLDSILKKQRLYFVNKSASSQGYGFSSGYVWM